MWPPCPWTGCEHPSYPECKDANCYLRVAKYPQRIVSKPAAITPRACGAEIVTTVAACLFKYHGVEGFEKDRSRTPDLAHYEFCECRRED